LLDSVKKRGMTHRSH